MYIIIKGGCHVRVNRRDEEGNENNIIVATLYDGQSFGELSLM
jgi:hypothetical protein